VVRLGAAGAGRVGREVRTGKAAIRTAPGFFSDCPPRWHVQLRDVLHAIALRCLDGLLIAAPKNHIDDEYAKVGTYDPKIVITTSRSPSSRLLQFSKVSPRPGSSHFKAPPQTRFLSISLTESNPLTCRNSV
jgi:hypothetical protein